MGWFEEANLIARWNCKGCNRWEDFDRAEYLARVGPSYIIWNELSVCECGAPRTLHVTTGPGTPFRPHRDEWLWIGREIGYGKDPDAWFTIDFVLDW